MDNIITKYERKILLEMGSLLLNLEANEYKIKGMLSTLDGRAHDIGYAMLFLTMDLLILPENPESIEDAREILRLSFIL